MQMTEAYELYKNKEITLEEYNQITQPIIQKSNRWETKTKAYKFKNADYKPF